MFTKTSLALVGVLATTQLAGADTLSGWGTRDWQTFHSNFMGEVKRLPDGSLTGHFTLITFNDNEDTVFCRYLRFRPNRITGASWQFYGEGVCISASSGGYYPVTNHFAIIDYGSPGTGVDYIDVNYLGPIGPSVPGGFLNSGDMTYTP